MTDPLTEALDIIERHQQARTQREICPHCKGTGTFAYIARCAFCAGRGYIVVEAQS
jgi:DnaJ-class molecular chaperone